MSKINSVLQTEQKDNAKLAYMQQYRAKRAAAIHDPVVRSRAIAPDECDRQVKEKYARVAAEKEAARLAAEEHQRISRLIARQELEDKDKRKRNDLGVKQTWQQQSDRTQRTTAYLDRMVTKVEPIQPEICSLAAAQQFAGEDRSRAERKRLQHRQISSWSKQQQEEKRSREALERKLEKDYIQQLDEVDKLCQQSDKAAEELKRRTNVNFAQANSYASTMRKSQQGQELRKEWARDALEMKTMAEDGLLAELGGPGRMDFKGFAPEVRQKFEEENQQLVIEQQAARQQVKIDERQYAKQMMQLNKTIVRSEVEEQRMRKERERKLQQAHKFQMIEQQNSRQRMAKQAVGEVSPQFYQSFGTSYR